MPILTKLFCKISKLQLSFVKQSNKSVENRTSVLLGRLKDNHHWYKSFYTMRLLCWNLFIKRECKISFQNNFESFSSFQCDAKAW